MGCPLAQLLVWPVLLVTEVAGDILQVLFDFVMPLGLTKWVCK